LLRLQKIREQEMIKMALVESGGNVSQAARRLSVSRQLLHYKMKKYGLQRQAYILPG
jgi:arginine utilization regulatory protein